MICPHCQQNEEIDRLRADLDRTHAALQGILDAAVVLQVHVAALARPAIPPLARPTVMDADFTEFKAVAHRRKVLMGGDSDWTWALTAWRMLNPEQRAAALLDLRDRPADTPEMRSLPRNYLALSRRLWERPLPKQAESAVSSAVAKLRAEGYK